MIDERAVVIAPCDAVAAIKPKVATSNPSRYHGRFINNIHPICSDSPILTFFIIASIRLNRGYVKNSKMRPRGVQGELVKKHYLKNSGVSVGICVVVASTDSSTIVQFWRASSLSTLLCILVRVYNRQSI